MEWGDCQHIKITNGYCEYCGLNVDTTFMEIIDCGINNQYTLENYLNLVHNLKSLPCWLKDLVRNKIIEEANFPLTKENKALQFIYETVRDIGENSISVKNEPFILKHFEDELFDSKRAINQAKRKFSDNRDACIIVRSPIELIPFVCRVENKKLIESNQKPKNYEKEIINLARNIMKKDIEYFFLEMSPEQTSAALYKIYSQKKKSFYNKGFAKRHKISENILKNSVERIEKLIKKHNIIF